MMSMGMNWNPMMGINNNAMMSFGGARGIMHSTVGSSNSTSSTGGGTCNYYPYYLQNYNPMMDMKANEAFFEYMSKKYKEGTMNNMYMGMNNMKPPEGFFEEMAKKYKEGTMMYMGMNNMMPKGEATGTTNTKSDHSNSHHDSNEPKGEATGTTSTKSDYSHSHYCDNVPSSTTITYEGILNAAYFKLNSKEKKNTINLEISLSSVKNPISNEKEVWVGTLFKSKYDGEKINKLIDLSIALDISYSMGGDKIILAKKALIQLFKN